MIQRGSLGANSPVTATVQIDTPDDSAHLLIEQIDVSDTSAANSEFAVAIERWTGEGFSFKYAPLTCKGATQSQKQSIVGRTQPASTLEALYAQAVEEKQVSAAPTVMGEVTTLAISKPAKALTITCDQHI